MNKAILPFLLLLVLDGFSQNEIVYNIDENISVQIPDNYIVVDTFGLRNIVIQYDTGIALIQIIPNEGSVASSVRNKKELLEFYNGFRKGVFKITKAELLSEEVVELGKLKLKQFSYKAVINDEVQIRYALVLLLNDNVYSIQMWQPEIQSGRMQLQRANLFSSVSIKPGFTLKDQLSPD